MNTPTTRPMKPPQVNVPPTAPRAQPVPAMPIMTRAREWLDRHGVQPIYLVVFGVLLVAVLAALTGWGTKTATPKAEPSKTLWGMWSDRWDSTLRYWGVRSRTLPVHVDFA